jgi:heme/copper-type cytochrome/quinol oxidase subunit 1
MKFTGFWGYRFDRERETRTGGLSVATSILIKLEIYFSGNKIISPENISITLHGFLLVFILVMPGLFGIYVVPIFQWSPEMVYSRVNNVFSLFSYFFLNPFCNFRIRR